MKKGLYTGIVLLASMLMASCASDEPAGGKSDEAPFAGGKAYLNVSIAMSGDAATKGEDIGTMLSGSTTYNQVNRADFFFFGASGEYLCKASVWNGGSANDGSDDGNIDFFGTNVLLLENVTSKPKYVVTLLNATSQYTAESFEPTCLEDFRNYMANGSDYNFFGNVSTVTAAGNIIIMSTSTYEDTNRPYNFVTEIPDGFLKETASEASSSTPLDIYVERLSALVCVDPTNLINKRGAQTINKGFYYEASKDISIEGWSECYGCEGNSTLYVRLHGCDLTGTTQNSYLMKRENSSWTDTQLGFVWNKSGNYRSHWCMSYNYSSTATSADYPDKYYATNFNPILKYKLFGYETGKQTVDSEGHILYKADVNYFPLGGGIICAENTNTSAVVTAFPNSITNAVIKAQIVHLNNGTCCSGHNLVKYNGKLYTQEAYIAYVYNILKNQGKLNYKCNGEQIAAGDLWLVDNENVYNGRIKIALRDDSKSGNWYTTSGTKVADSVINDVLGAYNIANEAQGYRLGYMYYSAPIEHLNNTAYAEGENIPEATYGIVRNHLYMISLNDITKEGTGVWEPTEPIVPNQEETGNNMDVKVNVLSWKVVNGGAIL